MIASASGRPEMGVAVSWLRAHVLPRPPDVARRADGPKGTPR